MIPSYNLPKIVEAASNDDHQDHHVEGFEK